MTADRLATLARRAAADPGDVQAQAAWLRARVQAGELPRERVELASYCGDAGARVVAPCGCRSGWHGTSVLSLEPCSKCNRAFVFERWLRGLARWSDEVMVRAVVAAARLVILGSEYCKCGGCGCPVCCDCGKRTAPLLAIKAAEAYLSDPSEESLKKRRRIWDQVNIGDGAPLWAPWGKEDGRVSGPVDRVTNAVREAGEQPVREAIQRALVEWALA